MHHSEAQQQASNLTEACTGSDLLMLHAGSLPSNEEDEITSMSSPMALNPRRSRHIEICRLDIVDRVPAHHRRLRQLAHAGHVMVAQGWEHCLPASQAAGAKRQRIKTTVWAVTAHVGFCNIPFLTISRVGITFACLFELCMSSAARLRPVTLSSSLMLSVG